MTTTAPKQIYSKIQEEVNSLLNSLSTETTDDDIKKAQQNAQEQLIGIHKEIDCAIQSLEKNSEWDTFCIAFYGETNAGKSTLIETLRILLNEPIKQKERERYVQIVNESYSLEQELLIQKEEQEKLTYNYNSEREKNKKIIEEHNTQISLKEEKSKQISEKITELGNRISHLRKKNIKNFFRALFKKLEEQVLLNKLQEELSVIITEIDELTIINKEKTQQFFEIESKYNIIFQNSVVKIESTQRRINKNQSQLQEYSDGKIIGDGHSDFTRVVTDYHFEYNGQKFALLDLPGIEGKEDLVLNVITDAVQKAHAVFYISGKPTPPQSGDDEDEGTLGKVKKHLGQQTEVYSIFNKRIKNPQQLQPGLIDDDERQSLKDLDSIMRNRLGDQYANHIVLSAYPAFLSVAHCWRNDFAKSQQKFFEKINSQTELLHISLVERFKEWLTSTLVKDCKTKIVKSNIKKVKVVLTKATDDIGTIYSSMSQLYDKLLINKKNTDQQLEISVDSANRDFSSELIRSLHKFESVFRDKIYKDIDREISNDVFKNAFEVRKEESIEYLSKLLNESFNKILQEFKSDITQIIEKYQRYASNLITAFENTDKFTFNFTPKIDIKSGVNLAGVITSVVGAVAGIILCLSNPAGWVVLALSILGAVISIGKAIIGFINHDYRTSQQKKAANENIQKIREKIEESVRKNLEEANEKLIESINEIIDDLQKNLNSMNKTNQTFAIAEKKLRILSKEIQI